jgi:2'-5' RNA ligase
MRTFIAVRCPDEIKKQLAAIQKEIGGLGDLRMVEPGNIHLTLRFLGEVEDAKVPDIVEALGGIRKTPFQVSIKGIGAFPGPKSPRVVWAGVEKGVKELEELHKGIDSILEKFRFERDERFACHYTIARVKYVKDKNALSEAIEKYKDIEFGSFTAEGMDLMESKLTPNGPIYTPVKSVPFTP